MSSGLQMAMFAPKSEWVPPQELPPLWEAKQIAIDVETRDPDLKTMGPGWPTGNGEVVGYALAIDGWKGYIPIRHIGGGNLDGDLYGQESNSIAYQQNLDTDNLTMEPHGLDDVIAATKTIRETID